MALKITNTDPGIHFKKGKNTYKTEKFASMNIREEVKAPEEPKEEPKKLKKVKTEE